VKENQKERHLSSKTIRKNVANSYQKYIDWTGGRFSGEIRQIFVRDGKIMEKVFLTSKGNRIFLRGVTEV